LIIQPKHQLGWIGVDLDATLAHYEGWNGGKIGAPIPAMVQRVREWLGSGQRVKIITARVACGSQVWDVEEQRHAIEAWCLEHIGVKLEVTCQKDFAMIQLYDDRCVQVVPNTGRLVTDYPYPNEQAAAILLGLHPAAARPRGESWLHERANWETQVGKLQAVQGHQLHELNRRSEKIKGLGAENEQLRATAAALEAELQQLREGIREWRTE
jgi:hypothetical protein